MSHNKTINRGNCIIIERDNVKDKALSNVLKNNEYEAKQKFIVERFDRKTTFYKPVPDNYKASQSQIIHKGRI